MNKPSNKTLYAGIASVVLLTIVGVVFTLTSYQATQKHALNLAMKQLENINQSAIKITTLEIQSYQLSLDSYATQISLTQPSESTILTDTAITLPESNEKSQAVQGIYLLSSEGVLLASKKLGPDDTTVENFYEQDSFFAQAKAEGKKQTGDTYFDNDQSFLNLYCPVTLSNQQQGLLILPLNMEKLYLSELNTTSNLSGYTMVKDKNMEVVMHPSTDQVSLSIVEDRKEREPNLDFTDLERLEKEQSTNQKGTLIYYSYWWTEENPKRVQKIAAYEWVDLGNAHLIFASNADLYERNGLLLQDSIITVGLLIILLVVLILLSFSIKNFLKKNQTYLENQRLKERQQMLQEKHDLEKNMLQESKLETIGLLTTSIVHDMNNFLTPMIGNLQLLIDEHQDNSLLKEDLQEVYHAAEKGQQLSSNVLRFSKVSSLKKNSLHVTQVIEEAIATIKPLIPKSISLVISLSSAGISTFEKDDLQVIVYNLITNAYQAKIDGTIKITTYRAAPPIHTLFDEVPYTQQDKEVAIIEIADNGPGIPKKIQDRIFTPFFTTKTSSGGTGLGLFTVASIIKKNDWLIRMHSTSKGTVFRIGIPLDKESLNSEV